MTRRLSLRRPALGDDIARSNIGFTPEEEKLLVNPDLEFLAKRMAELKDFWDKEFKGG